MAYLEPDHRLVDGDFIRVGTWELTVIHTPGHTAGHICIYERTTGAMFTGDHALPKVNTAPALDAQSSPDPMGDYLTSLDRLREVKVGLALPGHLSPYLDLQGRLMQLRTYHEDRMAELRQRLASRAATAWKLSSEMRRTRTWADLSMAARITATAETLAHLAHLEVLGLVRARNGSATLWETVGRPA